MFRVSATPIIRSTQNCNYRVNLRNNRLLCGASHWAVIDIQGDSGGICITVGYDSMSDSKQKSSYEHGSDFEWLRSYDHLKLGIEGNDY